jgi:hypothetical protein
MNFVRICSLFHRDGGDERLLLIWMIKVLKNEDIELRVILQLMHGDLFLICDDSSHYYHEKMNE